MYGHNDIKPVNRHNMERENPHPLMKMYMEREDSITFSREEVRARVIPAYMGLIKQIDDHIGRLLQFLEDKHLMDNTVVVFTSDHGDYLGDHWLGEKELFHEESVRIPLIVYDPDRVSNNTRGKVDDRLVEAIDLVPTFIDIAGGKVPDHILEGSSLLPVLHGDDPKDWRNFVISESEYAPRIAFWDLGLEAHQARATMIRTKDWKYIFHECFRPELFDMKNDPEEFEALGANPAYEDIREKMKELMFTSLRNRRTRVTRDNAHMKMRAQRALSNDGKKAVYIGVW